MSSNSTSTIARKLIRAFFDITSTEEFILYVAGTDNMLSFCQNLIEQHDRDNHALMTLEVNSACAEQGIVPDLLYSEIRKVLIALNRFHDASQDHYATLGLQKDASTDEIKKAYRQLSKSYHPDMVQNKNHDTQRFMQISGAYHAIMANLSDTKLPNNLKPWRKKSRSLKIHRQRDQKKFIIAIILLIFILAGASFYAAEKFNQRMVLRQIETSSQLAVNEGDLIPPIIEPASPPNPPPEDLVSKETLPAIAISAKEELPVIPSVEENITISPPPQLHTDDRLVQDIDSLDTPEPYKQEDQAIVASPLNTKEPEVQVPVQQIAIVNEIEKVKMEERVEQRRPTVPENLSPPTTEKQTEQNNQKQKIEEILAEYTKLYSSKDLELFLTLFNDNATENGQLQVDLIDQYKSFFTHTEAINIDLGKMNWEEFQDGFQGIGTFRSKYTYKDGSTRDHTGDITFYLRYEQSELKIQSLDYVFLN